MNNRMFAAVALGMLWVPVIVHATSVRPDEQAAARAWAAAKLEGKTEAPRQDLPGLKVLANNDPVQLNARGGRPMRIVDRQYARGLYCHAVSKVVVRLPAPGKTLSAVIGVDSNDQTRPGKGSVVFAVRAGEKDLYRSKLKREGMAGEDISVDLGGAREFTLEVADGGDGIGCDQADWADAKVTLQDGKTVWLGELCLLGEPQTVTADPPFSFVYGDRPSAELLKGWPCTREARKLDAARTAHTIVWSDPATRLQVRCEAIEYRDFPTVEWTLHFRNAGPADTPILRDIQSMDVGLHRAQGDEFVLHHHVGSPCRADDYMPLETELKAGQSKRIAAAGGRPTNSDLPYFNIQWGGGGAIVVVGWPGQWAATFERDSALGLRVRAGQELTHFLLHPGEEARTPLSVVQFYRGDRVRAQNVWRRWMLAHNLPRPGGKLPPVQMAACSSHQYGEMIHANPANQMMFIDRYLAEQLKLDYWWMDAGWYVNRSGWPDVGTWEVDLKRFPKGLREISDHAHAKGVRTIVWFEPERVVGGTWLAQTHPEWVLGGKKGGLLNLGNAEARAWLTEHVDRLLVSQGVDLYRQDFNMDPLGHWRAADAKDRQGIAEIRHCEGYLAYWDELRRRHPDMLIDSCASGGRRNDLETLRRAVPLLRSDFIIHPEGNQGHTYGIASWMPYYGTGSGRTDAYGLRSVLCPHFTACFDMRRKDLDLSEPRRVLGQWRQWGESFFGDYYPLTPYSLAETDWIAWQFDRPEVGTGVVQAFRRPRSVYESARLKLRGLEEAANYTVTDLDSGAVRTASGRELMHDGLLVTMKDQPGSAVVTYLKKQD